MACENLLVYSKLAVFIAVIRALFGKLMPIGQKVSGQGQGTSAHKFCFRMTLVWIGELYLNCTQHSGKPLLILRSKVKVRIVFSLAGSQAYRILVGVDSLLPSLPVTS